MPTVSGACRLLSRARVCGAELRPPLCQPRESRRRRGFGQPPLPCPERNLGSFGSGVLRLTSPRAPELWLCSFENREACFPNRRAQVSALGSQPCLLNFPTQPWLDTKRAAWVGTSERSSPSAMNLPELVCNSRLLNSRDLKTPVPAWDRRLLRVGSTSGQNW